MFFGKKFKVLMQENADIKERITNLEKKYDLLCEERAELQKKVEERAQSDVIYQQQFDNLFAYDGTAQAGAEGKK